MGDDRARHKHLNLSASSTIAGMLLKAEFQPQSVGAVGDRSRHPRGQHRHPRQGNAGAARARVPARARPPADRGPARRRQDHARARAGEVARPALPAHPVHQRHAARRHPRRLDLRARQRRLQVPSRADLRAGDPRRRGEPRHAEDAVGAARGDGGAPGHRRRRDAQAAASRSSSSPRRTRPSRSAPSRCPSRSSTAS